MLRALGAVDGDGRVTGRGTRMARLGLHPRLARALLDGAAEMGARAAAEVVALLDDDTLAGSATDVDDALRALRSGSAPGTGRWRAEVTRLTRLVRDAAGTGGDGAPAGGGRRGGGGGAGAGGNAGGSAFVVGLAHPERVARRRAAGSRTYLMAGGTAADLPADGPEWIAVAVADRTPGATEARVRLAARADEEVAVRTAGALLVEEDEIAWRDGDVVARHVRRLGAIVLARRQLPRPDAAAVRDALLTGLRSSGLGLLRWTDGARRLRDRIATLHRVLGDPWPDVSDEALLADPDRWWAGRLTTARSRSDLGRVEAADVLRSVLDWRAAATLDELAPERLPVASGARITLDWSGDRPVLAVRVQEMFGTTTTPSVAGGRLPVVLHLLSPAGRPAAVTGDLASFWDTGYPQVRSELRGRYPKHAWPDDPRTASAPRPNRPR